MLLCIFKGIFFIKILQHGDLFPHTECGNKSPFSVKTDVTETQTAWVTVLKTYTRVPESLCRVLGSASAGEWGVSCGCSWGQGCETKHWDSCFVHSRHIRVTRCSSSWDPLHNTKVPSPYFPWKNGLDNTPKTIPHAIPFLCPEAYNVRRLCMPLSYTSHLLTPRAQTLCGVKKSTDDRPTESVNMRSERTTDSDNTSV